MSIAINANQISNTQLHGMITGDENLATKLEGWEAFKNFFIKILNHLPGVSIEDKEKKLRELYNQIYAQPGTDSGIANPGSLGKIWQAIVNLIELMDIDNAHSMEFSFSRDRDNDVTKTLHITIAGHELPDIVLDNNSANDRIRATILNHCATPKDANGNNDPAAVYQLKRDILNIDGNRVSLAFEAKSELIRTAALNRMNAVFDEVGL